MARGRRAQARVLDGVLLSQRTRDIARRSNVIANAMSETSQRPRAATDGTSGATPPGLPLNAHCDRRYYLGGHSDLRLSAVDPVGGHSLHDLSAAGAETGLYGTPESLSSESDFRKKRRTCMPARKAVAIHLCYYRLTSRHAV